MRFEEEEGILIVYVRLVSFIKGGMPACLLMRNLQKANINENNSYLVHALNVH